MNIDLRFGDCLELMKEIPDESIDMIFTDIPYGKNYKSNRQNRSGHLGFDIKTDRKPYFEKINGDEKIPDIGWLKHSYRVLKNDSAIYVCVHWETFGELKNQASKCGFKIKNMIVLNKSNHGMGDLRGQYAPKHELILFATKGRHLLNFRNGRENDIWNVPIRYSGAYRLHPNEKPTSWIIPAILNSSKENDVILDPFMGSGSTGDACKKTIRNFIGIDNDQKYFTIAKERLGC